MIRIGDRAFLFAWQAIRSATQPDADATAWTIEGVRWCRHRYSHKAPDHAVTIEIHRLDSTGARQGWSLMVVAEHWWDERHKPVRDALWATHLAGSRLLIADWIERQAAKLENSGQNGQPHSPSPAAHR